jgi:hypothetical protein
MTTPNDPSWMTGQQTQHSSNATLKASIQKTSTDLTKTSVVGNWYTATTLPSSSDVFQVFTQGTLYVALPRLAQTAMTIDQLAISTNVVGSAGSVSRLGVYQVTTTDPYAVVLSSAYATLLVDGGTVATDGTTGTKTITLGTPLVLSAGTWYALAVADQVAAPASHRVRSQAGSPSTPWGQTTAHGGVGFQLVTATGVTGALPATFTPTAFTALNGSSDNGVQFHRAT